MHMKEQKITVDTKKEINLFYKEHDSALSITIHSLYYYGVTV